MRFLSQPTRSRFTQDHQVPALRPDFRGEAEIVVPADEFELSAQLNEAEKLLREKDFGGDSSFNDHVVPVIVDGESQTFIIGLRDQVDHLSSIAGVYPHTVSLSNPASLVAVKNTKPDKAV